VNNKNSLLLYASFQGITERIRRPASVEGNWGFYVETEAAAIFARVKKNVAVIQRLYAVNISIHMIPCLRKFIEEEAAKLP
jgi:hypothetical protein